MKFQNRIIWTFNHGLNSTNRFSYRHEIILWFSKTDDYNFNIDPIRIPQLYPKKKHFKGPKKGQYSCNPLGKNPGDVWDITNIKFNHPEKTSHPCQFPEKLVERLILSMSNPRDLVLDPYMGSGTTAVVCKKHHRQYLGFEYIKKYVNIANKRLKDV
jgi:adenine-specific DNA-methyltransferase